MDRRPAAHPAARRPGHPDDLRRLRVVPRPPLTTVARRGASRGRPRDRLVEPSAATTRAVGSAGVRSRQPLHPRGPSLTDSPITGFRGSRRWRGTSAEETTSRCGGTALTRTVAADRGTGRRWVRRRGGWRPGPRRGAVAGWARAHLGSEGRL